MFLLTNRNIQSNIIEKMMFVKNIGGIYENNMCTKRNAWNDQVLYS